VGLAGRRRTAPTDARHCAQGLSEDLGHGRDRLCQRDRHKALNDGRGVDMVERTAARPQVHATCPHDQLDCLRRQGPALSSLPATSSRAAA